MRVRLWADIRLIYSCARAFGKTRRRALLLVLDSLWHGGGANPLALVTEAVERQDWRSAAAQLRSWNVAFDWESDAALQRSELINAADALEKGRSCHREATLRGGLKAQGMVFWRR
jgi:hypothetical protein